MLYPTNVVSANGAITGDFEFADATASGAAQGIVTGDISKQNVSGSGAVSDVATLGVDSAAGAAQGEFVIVDGKVVSLKGAVNGCVTYNSQQICGANTASDNKTTMNSALTSDSSKVLLSGFAAVLAALALSA